MNRWGHQGLFRLQCDIKKPRTRPSPANTQDQIALIGAGPSGLAGARHLQKMGIAFQDFKAWNAVSGLWNIENPRSTVYESAHLISSKRMTAFSEFPLADSVADHFDLQRHVHFGVRILQVEPLSDAPDSLWQVRTDHAAD